ARAAGMDIARGDCRVPRDATLALGFGDWRARMRLGMIGLGRMGGNMVRRLRAAGIEVAGFNRDPAAATQLEAECGMQPAPDVAALVAALAPPRVVWLMLPAGDVTEQTIAALLPLLAAGDLLVDGANSHFKDSLRRGADCAERGIDFVDAG